MDVLQREAALEQPEQRDVRARAGAQRADLASSPSTRAGRGVAASITSGSDMPRWRNFESVVGRSNVGPLTLSWWRSVEITSGFQPAAMTASATANENEPVPWPTSKTTPDSHARPATSSSRPSSSTIFIAWPVKQCVSTSPGFRNGSTSSIEGGPKAMCIISGSSHSSAASPRAPQRLERVAGERHEVAHPHLHAEHEVAVALDHAAEQADVAVPRVGALVVVADEADARDVHEAR